MIIDGVRMKVSNIVLTGKMPFKHFLRSNEMVKILEKSTLNWDIVNQDSSPMLIVRFKKNGLNKLKKVKQSCLSIWHSGNMMIAGVETIAEGKRNCLRVLNDLKKIIPRVFRE